MKDYIDLHLHSFHSRRNQDCIKWIDELWTLITMRDHHIKAFAITDHDIFSSKLFKSFQDVIASHKFDLTVFPGVEITIKRKNEEKGHILFIFDNNITEQQAKQLELAVYKSGHCYGASLDAVVKTFDGLGIDYIMIPHVGKCDSVVYEDVQDYMDKIPYVESAGHKQELVKFNSQSHSKAKNLMFSDTHIWDSYCGSKVYYDSDAPITLKTLKTNLKYEETTKDGSNKDN